MKETTRFKKELAAYVDQNVADPKYPVNGEDKDKDAFWSDITFNPVATPSSYQRILLKDGTYAIRGCTNNQNVDLENVSVSLGDVTIDRNKKADSLLFAHNVNIESTGCARNLRECANIQCGENVKIPTLKRVAGNAFLGKSHAPALEYVFGDTEIVSQINSHEESHLDTERFDSLREIGGNLVVGSGNSPIVHSECFPIEFNSLSKVSGICSFENCNVSFGRLEDVGVSSIKNSSLIGPNKISGCGLFISGSSIEKTEVIEGPTTVQASKLSDTTTINGNLRAFKSELPLLRKVTGDAGLTLTSAPYLSDVSGEAVVNGGNVHPDLQNKTPMPHVEPPSPYDSISKRLTSYGESK